MIKKAGLFSAAMAVIIAAAVTVSVNSSAQPGTVYEESQFTWSSGTNVSDSLASGGQARKLQPDQMNSPLFGTISIPASSQITVRARGDDCLGFANMRISLGANVIGDRVVTSAWADYSLTVPNPVAGQLKIELTNPFINWFFFSQLCQRSLYIDKIDIAPSGPPTTTTTTTTTTSNPPVMNDYVAMGDSYGSGWGADRSPGVPINNGVYDSTACGRSNQSYQYGIAADESLNLINASCGGTTTDHILTTSYQNEPPQIQKVTATAQLVTVIVGGNDTGLMWMLEVCVKSGNCWPGADWFADSFISQTDTKISALQAKIQNVINAILVKSPNAKIRLAGYPNIIAAPNESKGNCAAWLDSREQVWFQGATIRTNNAISQAVQAISTQTGKDIAFVDPFASGSPFLNRDSNGLMGDGCSTSTQRYMNGPNDGTDGMWHPNLIGAQDYRTLFAGMV